MQTFYMIIEKGKIYLYDKSEKNIEKLYIEGNPEYLYEVNDALKDTTRLMEALVNEYNLSSTAEIEFVVVDNEDHVISEVFEKVLSGYVRKKYPILPLLLNVSQKLGREKKLMIDEYGINYDTMNYRIINGKLSKFSFSLLGYTLQADELIKYIV